MKPAPKNKVRSKKIKPKNIKRKRKTKKSVQKSIAARPPLVKIASKIRERVLNIKAIETTGSLVQPPAKKHSKEPEFEVKKTKIRIIGVGGGGGNIVSEIAGRIKKASFFIANTDLAALRNAPKNVSVFQFGQKFTRGLGTGMDPQIGEEAVSESKEQIKKIVAGQDMVIIVSSLGGGAGSGAAPVFAQISKAAGNLTYGIFTLPFEFEGAKKSEIAKNALEKLKPYLNALTILPNERVFEVVPKATPFSKTLSFINTTLSYSLQGLIETIYDIGTINIDFADLHTILIGNGKMAFLNTVLLKKGEEVGIDSLERIFSSPLYPYSIDKARGLLLNIVAQKDLKLLEVNKILTGAASRIHKDAKIIFGVGHGRAAAGVAKVTLLATGCVYGETNNNLKDKRITPASVIKSSEQISKTGVAAAKASKKVKAKKTAKSTKKSQVGSVKKSSRTKKIKIKNIAAVKQKNEAAKNTPAENTQEPTNATQTPQSGSPVRKNALQVKKEIEMEEKEMLEKEKIWEVPAFLRKQKK